MNMRSAKLVYFSPTKTTKKIVETIAEGLELDTMSVLDLTPPEAGTRQIEEIHEGLAVIGTPVYGGRVPRDAVRRIKRLKGNDSRAVIVVVYGNREYEDALLELKDLVSQGGFKPIAGGAFIGEHSFSNEATPIAMGRPDLEDVKKAREFGKMVRDKLRDTQRLDNVPALRVPGNFPYKERSKPSKDSMVTQEDLCTKCETCSTVCPTGAISVEETVLTDPMACILCSACIKNCPTGARVAESPSLKEKAKWLCTNYSRRKEPEMYIA